MKKMHILFLSILAIALILSIGLNIYLGFFSQDSYLQSVDEIYIMEAGIIKNHLEFAEGESHIFTYDFQNPEYPELIMKYGIDKCAGEGSEFEKALRLMDEYAPRLTHKGNYDNRIDFSALALLEYSLDKRSNGINCRAKAQILNEMCLALGIYSRKVWIMPNSSYDSDCHVVNEIWDSSRNKWIMLDITNNQYWVDELGTPLSVLEIRRRGGEQEFCTPVVPGESLDDLERLKKRHIGEFLYIMKNMCYTEYCSEYGIGESKPFYLLFPEGLDSDYEFLISESAVTAPPDGIVK